MRKRVYSFTILLFVIVGILGSMNFANAAITNVHLFPSYPNMSSASVRVYADVTDNTKAALYYRIDDNSYSSPFSISKGFGSISYEDISDNVQVFYWIEATNSTGGKEQTDELNFFYDGSAPSTTDSASSAWGNGSSNIILSCSDLISGCKGTYYSIENINDNDSNSSSTDSANFSAYSSAFGFNQEGEYQLRYYSVDNAGNQENVKLGTLVKIDKTKPITSDNAPNTTSSQAVTITLTCEDNLSQCSQIYYSTDNSTNFILYSSPFTLSSTGVYQLRYYSIDNAGNSEDAKLGTLVVLNIPVSSGSGGGGGGGGGSSGSHSNSGGGSGIIYVGSSNHSGNCTENWQCPEWSDCVKGTHVRICTDLNSCGTTANRPVEFEHCGNETQEQQTQAVQNRGFLRTVGDTVTAPVGFVFSNLARVLIFSLLILAIGGFLVFKFVFKGDLRLLKTDFRKFMWPIKREIRYIFKIRRGY